MADKTIPVLKVLRGNVGIGSTTPTSNLEVIASGADLENMLRVTSGTAGRGVYIGAPQSATVAGVIDFRNGNVATRYLDFRGEGTSRMVIQTDGNVGIGTTAPGHPLVVVGSADKGISLINSSNVELIHMRQEAGDKGAIFLKDGGAVKVLFTARPSNNSYFNVNGANFGVGTSTPTRVLQVNGAAHATSHLVGSLTTALGIAGSFPDANDSELGPGYLVMTRDDTAAAKQLQFWKNGSLHSGLMTDTNGLNFVGSDGAADVTIKTDGKVGIGYGQPDYTLKVAGDCYVRDATTLDGTVSVGGTANGLLYIKEDNGSNTIQLRADVSNSYNEIDSQKEFNIRTEAGALRFSTANTERMRILADGKVGIGNTAPAAKLHVGTAPLVHANISKIGLFGDDVAGTAYPLTIANTNAATVGDMAQMTFAFGTGWSTTAWVGAAVENTSTAETALAFGTYSAAGLGERMRIQGDGNVGIGTTAPASMLEVKARASGGHPPLFLRRGATNESASLKLLTTTTEDWIVGMRNDGTSNFRIFSYGAGSDVFSIHRSNGNVGIGSATPAYALDVVGYAKVSLGIKVGGGSAGNSTNPAITVSSVNTAGVYFESSGVGFGSGSGTKKLFLKSDGDVGIGYSGSIAPPYGTTSPTILIIKPRQASSDSALRLARFADDVVGLDIWADGGSGTHDSYFDNRYELSDWIFRSGTRGAGTIDEVMRVTGEGSVGIGTNAPAQLLHLQKAGGPKLRLQETGAEAWDLYAGGSGLYIQQDGTYRFTIKDTGNVGIGITTNPAALLHVGNGNQSPSNTMGNPGVFIENSGTSNAYTALQVKTGGGLGLVVTNAANVGIGTATPSSKLHINGGTASQATGLTFGDGDTGFYEHSDDSLWYFSGGVTRWKSDSSYLFSTITTSKATIINEVASATNPVFTFYNDLDTGLGWAAANKLSLVAGGVGTVTVTSTAVGIGTSSPSSLLHLYGAAPVIRFQDSANGILGYLGDAVDFLTSGATADSFGVRSEGEIRFGTGGNNVRAVIDNVGKVGIGTTAPGYQLEVNGNLDIIQAQGTGANAFFRATSDASTADWSFGADEMSVGANKFIIYDRVNSAYRMTIDNAGNVGINDTTPTYKLDVNGTFRVTGAATFDSSISFTTVLAGNGSASLPSFAFTNDPNTGMYNDGANDNLKFSTGGVIRAFLTATQWNVTGNIVGVAGIFSGAVSGTTGTFTGNVAVSHGSVPHFQIQQTSGNAWRWYTDGTDSFIREATGGHNIAKFAANGDVGFYNPDGSATQFFWDSSAEKLGIGTSSPSESLHIYRGSGPEIRLQNSTRNWYLRSYGDRLDIYITGTSLQAFTILADGKIGIGATVPAVKLHLDSGATTELRIDGEAHELITFHKSSAQKGLVGYSNSDSTLKLCAGSGTIASNVNGISINANGNVGIGTATPSAELHVKSPINQHCFLNIDTTTAAYNPVLELKEAGTRRAYINYVSASNYLSITTEESGSDIALMPLAGSVGIGTTAPANDLHVKNTTGSPQLRLEAPAGYSTIYADSNLYFQPNGTTRMTIKSDGKVGINDTTPGYQLDVNGTFRVTGAATFDSAAYLNSTGTGIRGAYWTSTSTAVGSLYGNRIENMYTPNYLEKLLAYKVPTKFEVSNSSGSSFSDTTVTDAVAGIFNEGWYPANQYTWAQSSNKKIRFSFTTFGYRFVTCMAMRATTSSNTVTMMVEKSSSADFSSGVVTVFTSTGMNGWPGFWQIVNTWHNSGNSAAMRITLESNQANSTNITLNNIDCTGGYSFGSGGRILTGYSKTAGREGILHGRLGINASPSGYYLYVNGTSLFKDGVEMDDTLELDGNFTWSGYQYFTHSTARILANTADGADTKTLFLGGGGEAGQGRGAYVELNGNDHASTPGVLNLLSGNDGSVNIYSGGAERVTINNNGSIQYNGDTQQSWIQFKDAGTLSGYIGAGIGLAASPNNLNTDFAIRAKTKLALCTNDSNAAKVTILADGNVGIGTTAPAAMLEVIARASGGHPPLFLRRGANNESASLKLLTTTTEDWIVGMRNDGTSNFRIYSYGASSDVFSILRSNGNVGIGSATPAYALDVVGYAKVSLGIKVGGGSAGNSTNPAITVGSVNTAGVYFESSGVGFGSGSGTKKLFLKSDGDVGIGYSGSIAPPYGTTSPTILIIKPRQASSDSALRLARFADDVVGLDIWADGGSGTHDSYFDNRYELSDWIFRSGTRGAGTIDEVMRVTGEGSVGIGTTAPSKKLHVSGTTGDNSRMRFTDTSNSTNFDVGTDASGGFFSTIENKHILFYTNGSEKVRIQNDGNVGIGNATPGSKLVVQDAQVWAGLGATKGYGFHDFGTTFCFTGLTSPSRLAVVTNGTERLSITDDGIGIGTTSPGKKLEVVGEVRIADVGIPKLWFYDTSTAQLASIRHSSATTRLGIFDDSNNERFTVITEAGGLQGHVGIGTTAPTGLLHVNGPSDGTGYLHITDSVTGATAGNGMRLGYNSGELRLQNFESTDIAFFLGTIERVTFKSDGNCGIGTTAPPNKLTIDGGNVEIRNGYDLMIRPSGNGNDFRLTALDTGGGDVVWGGATTTSIMRWANNGRVGIGTTAPEVKLTVRQSAQDSGIRLYGHSAHSGSYMNFRVDSGGHTNIETSGGSYTKFSIGGYFILQTGANEPIYNDFGGTCFWRDVDASNTVRMQLDSASGNLAVTGNVTISNDKILSVGTTNGNSGRIRFYGGSGTSYYMDYQPVGTNDRQFRFNGSSSASAYTTYFNQQGSGNHNLYVDGDITSAGTGRYIYAVNLNVTGYKNFEIEHPTKENMMLVHSSLEGPEAGVYYRGRAQSDTITLPDYWTGLVRAGTITVQLTPNGSFQHLYVVSTSLSEIKIGAAEGETIDCYYVIYGERADVAPLVVEDADAWHRFQERKAAMSDGKA